MELGNSVVGKVATDTRQRLQYGLIGGQKDEML